MRPCPSRSAEAAPKSASISVERMPDTRTPLRILYVSTQLPAPQDAGGRIRSFHILRWLSELHRVTFLSLVSPDIDMHLLDQIKAVCPDLITIPHKHYSINSIGYLLKLFLNSFSSLPFGISKDRHPELARLVREVTGKAKFDLIICDYLHGMVNLRRMNSVPILLFQHNVEAEILRRHYEQSRNHFHRVFWFYQWKKLESFERRACQAAASCVAVSQHDQLLLKQKYEVDRVFVTETGVDISYFSNLTGERKSYQMLFTGSMDWLANEDAMIFFCQKIFPRIVQAIPDASLKIVGRYPSKRIRKLADADMRIQVTGRVEDVRPFLAESSLFVIPLRIGGGTRIKIYEAMASGIPVLSTPIGAEGLPVKDNVHLMLADTPETFADSAIRILRDRTLSIQIAKNAKAFVSENCDWENIGRQFSEICHATIKNQKGSFL
jgi:polysaccharide biosynthesis protein PslH